MAAEIVDVAEIVVVAAGVREVVADAVADAADVTVAAVAVVATAAVAEGGTNFCHGSARIPRIHQQRSS